MPAKTSRAATGQIKVRLASPAMPIQLMSNLSNPHRIDKRLAQPRLPERAVPMQPDANAPCLPSLPRQSVTNAT